MDIVDSLCIRIFRYQGLFPGLLMCGQNSEPRSSLFMTLLNSNSVKLINPCQMRPLLFYRLEPKPRLGLPYEYMDSTTDRLPGALSKSQVICFGLDPGASQDFSPPPTTLLPTLVLPHQSQGWVCQNREETKQLPIKLWSFPKHYSSYISLVSVWACGWSWSYIHTSGSGLFGIQIGHSQTLHTPSVREKGFEHFYTFDLKIYEKGTTVYKSIVFFQHEMSAIHSTIYSIYLIFKNPVSKINARLRIHDFSGN